MERLENKVLAVILVILLAGCVFAITVVIKMERNSLHAVTDVRAEETAIVISKSIERTMLNGDPEVTRALVHDLLTSKGVEDIGVFNSAGREAFTNMGITIEAEAMAQLMKKKDVILDDTDDAHIIYKPLINRPECQTCHGADKPMLGAIKISVPKDFEKKQLNKMLITSIIASFFAILALSLIMIFALRKVVIRPIGSIENAAMMLADGDLSFPVDIESNDEIKRLSDAMKESLRSISGILGRVSDVSARISRVASTVENESGKVLEGTQVEGEAIDNISSSVDELNVAISEISEGSDSLAATVEEIAASMEQMSASITQIGKNTLSLFSAMEDTSASIEEMSITIKEVSAGADKLALSSDDTNTAMSELDSSIKEVERNAKESSALSSKVLDDATNVGLSSVKKTIDGMELIRKTVERTAGIVRRLGDRSEEVGKILNVIDEITEQTTLLALNAAILASQAGEHGKGFSVVADEIKDLAERTSFSTQEISALIGSVQTEVGDAVKAMEDGVASVQEGFKIAEKSSDALSKIVASAERSSEMSAAIEKATEQQAKAVALVSESMDRVRAMISSIARSTSEQAKGASLIMEATEKVRDITAQVKNASEEQSSSSIQMAKAMDTVSDNTHQISVALREQREGAVHIKKAINNILQLPEENRERAFVLNRSLRDLKEDAELMMTEMRKFNLVDVRMEDVIKFGVVPLASPAEMFNRFSPLMTYLSKRTGKKFELKVAMDLNEAVSDIIEGVTQMCYMTPSTYIRANKEGGVRVLVKALRDGKPFHHSAIIANPDKGIKEIKDIKGRSFAFGDKNSTSSYIVPRSMLNEAGIGLNDLTHYNFLNRQDAVAKAVLNGEFDAGGVMESTALKFKEEGLKIVKFSEEIPEFNICAGRAVSDDDATEVQDAVLALDDSDAENSVILRAIDRNYTGFTLADDVDYMSIRDKMSKLDEL
ncbi:MAG: phosphate/phosphite/phosphonate ABC transporter substrate-binding protein [Nitrospirota bacterium]|nr:MAG: phosphate/phosphite/phosphonate ABC transporter substrate-binding protein [Nitrospirota bacterium]